MKIAATLFAGAACFAMPMSAIAQDTKCVSRAESQAVVAHLMPTLLESVGKNCAPKLNGTSYLTNAGRALPQKFTALSRQSWPTTKIALERQGGTKLPDNEALLDLGRVAIAEGIATKMDAKACGVVDQLAEQLAPLPPQNFANVFALFLETGLNESEGFADQDLRRLIQRGRSSRKCCRAGSRAAGNALRPRAQPSIPTIRFRCGCDRPSRPSSS